MQMDVPAHVDAGAIVHVCGRGATHGSMTMVGQNQTKHCITQRSWPLGSQTNTESYYRRYSMIDDIRTKESVEMVTSEMVTPNGCACGCSCMCICQCIWPWRDQYINDYGWSKSDSVLWNTAFQAG